MPRRLMLRMRRNRDSLGLRLRAASTMICLAMPLGLAMPAEAGWAAYKKGTSLRIEGRVSGPDGAAVAGAELVLTAEREGRRLLSLGGTDRGPVAVKAKSGAEGRFAIDWIWDGYHDRFFLEVVLEAAGERPRETLASLDLTGQMTGENPIRIDIAVPDASLIRFTNRVAAGNLSSDEQRLLAELGRPLRYEERSAAGRPETQWWYFDRGRMYRFEAGSLAQVVHFDPVVAEE